jgi:predicted RNase H-like nuclease (RuvC/YqgF family)
MFNKSATGTAYVTKFANTNVASEKVIKSTDGDIRDLRVENTALRKELSRKDTRNDNISKELNNLRTNSSNCQRDLRILTGTFDKVNNERHNLTNEVYKAKEYIDKLEQQLARLSDTHTISSQNTQFRIEIDNLTNEINQNKQKIISKDDYIKSLERDLSILRRSIDIQMESEKHMLKGIYLSIYLKKFSNYLSL